MSRARSRSLPLKKAALLGVGVSLALTAGVALGTARPASADAAPHSNDGQNTWTICLDPDFSECTTGNPARLPNFGGVNSDASQAPWNNPVFDNQISSLWIRNTPLDTWNGENFTGTFGQFAANWEWDSLNTPYNDAISSAAPG